MNQKTAHQVPLLTLVVDPRKRPTAMKAKPMATTRLTASLGDDGVAAVATSSAGSGCLKPGGEGSSDHEPADQRQQADAASQRVLAITAWKYWGIANSSPNIAKETMVASTVPR